MTPAYCCPRAFESFSQQVPLLDTTAGLFKAAFAVSMHALDDVSYASCAERIDHLGQRVLRGVRSRQPEAVLAHLHRVLFDEEQFQGNHDDYYNPLNSYLPAVMESRRGIPLSLTLIYKLVAQRVGIEVQGLNTPGHFLALVRQEQPCVVDPYSGGRILSLDEVRELAHSITGVRYPDSVLLRPACHRSWISRLLANLQNIFQIGGREADLAAMNELQQRLTDN